jgi:uncharacterized Zn-finger protein
MTFKLPVICPFCEKEVVYDWSEFIVDQEKDHGEVENTIECDEFECPYCKENFNVFGSIYEAPKGTYSYHELSAEPIQE